MYYSAENGKDWNRIAAKYLKSLVEVEMVNSTVDHDFFWASVVSPLFNSQTSLKTTSHADIMERHFLFVLYAPM
jgi:hypothetical protein